MKAVDYDERFNEHLQEHSEILGMLVEGARQLKRAGRRHVSIRVIWESVRLQYPECGGLNDHFHSRYARLVMEVAPDLQGMFYTRRLRTEHGAERRA